VRLGRRASLQRQFNGGEHGLVVMLEDQGQNLDHLAVAARRFEHALLQGPEGRRQLGEGRAIAERARLALKDREIVSPVEDGCRARALVGASEDADVLADDPPLGGDDDTLGINPHADRSIGERRRHGS
jgi:hypothetical protein